MSAERASTDFNLEQEADANNHMFVTMRIDQQLFGIPVKNVRDVLREQKITSIPLSAPEVAGSLNLRGRIVTVINLRCRLRLGEKQNSDKNMFVVVEYKNELFSLVVDSVGEVMTVPERPERIQHEQEADKGHLVGREIARRAPARHHFCRTRPPVLGDDIGHALVAGLEHAALDGGAGFGGEPEQIRQFLFAQGVIEGTGHARDIAAAQMGG